MPDGSPAEAACLPPGGGAARRYARSWWVAPRPRRRTTGVRSLQGKAVREHDMRPGRHVTLQVRHHTTESSPPRRTQDPVQHAYAPPALLLDRYRLVRRLGSGGFGTVWLADDERLGRPVAVKRVPTGDAATAERARREALAAARLSHPGIVALYETDADEEACYLVSELVRGETPGALEEEGALSDRDVVEIGAALCEALAHAHARGVVHRDVKPGNVLVPEAGEEGGSAAKLTDFGIARVVGDDALTATGDILGTLAYMAPEQAEGRGATPASDLYALGLVLFEALSGTNPIRGASPAETARRVGTPLPPLRRLRRDLPDELCAAIDRAVEIEPAARGKLGDLKRGLLAARAAVSDEPGVMEEPALDTLTRPLRAVERRLPVERVPLPLEPGEDARERPRVTVPARVAASLAAGALAAAAVLGFDIPVQPVAAAAATAGAVLLLPRLGWLAAALALVAWLAADDRPGTALLVAAAVAPVPVLTWRARAAWSLPAAAPLLGLATLATAYPALAGQARTLPRRAGLGALGALYVVLAEPLLERTLLGGAPRATGWQGSADRTLHHVLGPAFDVRLLGLAAAFAVAAAVLPYLVRGRHVGAAAVAAIAWWAGLAAATQAALAPVEPRGLIAGAAVGAVAVLVVAGARAGRAPLTS